MREQNRRQTKRTTKRKKGPGAVGTGTGPLLTYMPSSMPSPLQVSTVQTNLTGILNTAALSEGGQSVYCNKVLISVPVGTGAGNLYQSTPSASVNTGKWAPSSLDMQTGRDLGLDNDLTYATFTFNCQNATDNLINYNLVFGLEGQVNQTPGVCQVQILESSGTSPGSFTNKQTSYSVTTVTPQFYLMNFATTAIASPTVPCTEFTNGAGIRFSWESNGTFFQIYQKNQPTPIYSGTQTTYTLTGGVATDTTFMLVASMTGNPSGDTPSGGYETIYLYDSITVTITNPSLTPTSVVTSGNASIGGTLGVTGNTTLSNASVSGTLGVNGNATLASANITGALGVTGNTTLSSASVSSTLGVSGNTTLTSASLSGPLTVAGATTLNGGLNALSNIIAMMLGGQGLGPGTYTANTDGFALGVVNTPGNFGQLSWAWIVGVNNTDNITATASGGNVCLVDSNSNKYSGPCNNSFLLPIRKGSSWSLGVTVATQNQATPAISFYWIPLGTVPSGSTFERLSDEQPIINQALAERTVLPTKAPLITELVGIIEKILGKSIDRQTRKRLLSVLEGLQVEEATWIKP